MCFLFREEGMVWQVVWGMVICTMLGNSVGAQDIDTVVVRIVHSNDVMGQLRSVEREGEEWGGMAQRVALIRMLMERKDALILDAGNTLGPNALSAWDEGKTMVAAMVSGGYTAMTPGNHEFDHGLDVLAQRQKETQFPLLATNLRGVAGRELPVEGYRIFEVADVKVAVIGAVSAQLDRRVNPSVAEALVIDDPLKRVVEGVKTLRELGAEYVVLLAHMPMSEVMTLAQKAGEIDLVVAGGDGQQRSGYVPTLTRLMNGVQVVTTPRGGRYLGMVDVMFVRSNEKFRAVNTQAQTLEVAGNVDEAVVSLIADLEQAYADETGDALGLIAGKDLDHQAEVVSNLMRWHTKMEVGMVHRGAFREKAPADSLFSRDVGRFVRFDDVLVKLEVSGSQLKAIVKRSKRAGKGDGGLIFAGLDVKEMQVNGRDIQNKEPYQVVTLAYLVEGGAGYGEFRDGSIIRRTQISLRSLLVNGLKVWGTLNSEAFAELDHRRVWRSGWAVEGAFRRNYVDGTAENYRQHRERVSFLRGETSVAWNASTRYFLNYESGPHAVLLENTNDFGQVGTSFGNLETSSDRLDAEVTYRRRIRRWQIHPFVSNGINTTLTSGNGSRPFQLRSSLGFQRRFGRMVVQFAGRGQQDFAESQTDFGAEVTLNYQRRLQQGGQLRSRVKSFFGLTDRKVISIENYNTLSFPLAGSLSLTVRQNNFIYRVDKIRDVQVSGIATRSDLTVGLAYVLDWKWF